MPRARLPNAAGPVRRGDDVGVVANAYPDMSFFVYHSAFDPAVAEGPYNPAWPNAGIDPEATLCAIGEDDLAKARSASAEAVQPGFRAYGPQTRREMLGFLRSRGGEPG